MLAWILCALIAVDDVALAPIPPTKRPPPGTRPVTCVLERDSGVSDRLADADQTVEYAFDARAGENVLFGLEAFGYERGWRSGARIRIVDERGEVLLAEDRAGPAVWHQLTVFRAPADGAYAYRMTSVDRPFRYRLTRRERARAEGDEVEPFALRERVSSFTR